MDKPSYTDLERRVKELEQLLQSEVRSQDFQFDTKDLIHFRGYRDWSADFFDRKIENLTGYRLEDFLDRRIKWLDIVYEDDRDIAQNAVKRALRSDKYYRAEYRIVSRQGDIKWIIIRGYIVCDDEGKFLSVQGVLNEITVKKYTELALDSEHEIFAWVANNVEDGIYIVSEDYHLQFMNKALIDLVGDHLGEVCYQALFQRDSVCPWSVMNNLKRGAPGFQEIELPGSDRIFEVRSFAITVPESAIAKMGIFKDVTYTRRLQKEVDEFAIRQQAIENAANRADLGICVLQDDAGIEARIRFVNEAFCRFSGYRREELLQKSIAGLTRGDTRQSLIERYRQRRAGKSLSKEYEFEMVCKDGTPISLLCSAALSMFEGRVATIVFLRDITERKRVQRALWQSQRLASIGRLAAEVAHEINNPLAVVLTYINLMHKLIGRERFTPERLEDVKRYLLTMENEVSRCGEIVKGLLDFARREEIEVKENDIQEILEKTLDIVRHRCELGGIEIITSYAAHLPSLVCDFKRLQQPFLNIIWNAIEAMPKGGTLRVATSLDENQEFFSIDISDTGIGIPQEDLGNIFEPFFSTKEKGKGVGLGLSVAYAIIQRHYGQIFVHSQVGKGTQFTIQLPAGDEVRHPSRVKLLWPRPGGQRNEKKVLSPQGGETQDK